MIGIIGAMNEEINLIKNEMTKVNISKIGSMEFIKGNFRKKDIVLVKSGIGKVNASITATIMILKFEIDYVIFSGVGGALDPKLKIGDMVVSEDTLQYDMDATEFGHKKGVIPQQDTSIFKADESLVCAFKNIKLREHNIFTGRIISGDKFVSDKKEKASLGKEFDAMCVDMESSAVAQACYHLNKPFVILRSISDSLTDESVLEYTKFLSLAVENLKQVLDSFFVI